MSKKYNALFTLLVFVLIALYQFFLYKPFLLYFQFQPAFYFDVHFINGFFEYPGGLSELMSLFVFQFFANKLTAVLLFSGILFSLYWFSMRLTQNLFAGSLPLVVCTVPAILIMMLYNAYNVPLLVAFKFAAVFFLAWLYSFDKMFGRVLLLIALPFIYFVLGGWFTGVFVTLVVAIHLVSGRLVKTAFLPLLFAGVFALSAYLSARYLFFISLKEAFLYVLPFRYFHEPIHFHTGYLFYIVSFSLPVMLLLWRLVDIFFKVGQKSRSRLFALIINSAVVLLMFWAAMFFTFKKDERRKIFINYLADNSQWQEVFNESKKIREYDRIVEFQANRAMYFNGCLLDSLFFVDHPTGVNGLFVDRIMTSQIAMFASDLYFDLGHINAAQVMAYEYQTKYRYDPRVLKRLALTNAINGHYLKAEKFVKLLSKSPVHKSWAQENAALLDESTAAKMHIVALKRLHQPKKDFFLHSQSPNIDLAGLLETSGTNKMAFEYVMAYYLLECRMGNIAGRIDMIKQFDYPAIPRHLEEALIMYQTGTRRTGGALLQDVQFNRESIHRFSEFNKIVVTYKTNEQRRAQLIQSGYDKSFWYYLFDGGGSRTNTLKKRKVEGGY